jgi:hypothetical protein
MLCLQGLRLKAAGQLVGSFPGGTVVRFGPVAAEDRLGPLGKRGGIGAGIMRIMKGVPGFARDDGCEVLYALLRGIPLLLCLVEAVLEGPDGFFHAGWRRATFADRSGI